jgi:DNA adenine methylase
MFQNSLFEKDLRSQHQRPKGQLLKWIGSKYRMAEQITAHFPPDCGRLWDVFLGSGVILATAGLNRGVGCDVFAPVIEIWKAVQSDPAIVKAWYRTRWERMINSSKVNVYEEVKASYNSHPNGGDFLFLSRACYGGVVRFRKMDGYMSTPCGPHQPISPESFDLRVDEWHRRIQGCEFHLMDYSQAMDMAQPGDVVYCDPPYTHSQGILYGAQTFSLPALFQKIAACKKRGVHVALSIDGTKKSGEFQCDLPIPVDLFEQELTIPVGRSMLKRFQMYGKDLSDEWVTDRLLLTYPAVK